MGTFSFSLGSVPVNLNKKKDEDYASLRMVQSNEYLIKELGNRLSASVFLENSNIGIESGEHRLTM